MTITFTKVSLPYGWLGNMSRHPIIYQDILYPTCEHLFHCLRLPINHIGRQKILEQKSPMAAKMVSKTLVFDYITQPWSNNDVKNMILVVQLKIEQYPELALELDKTGDLEIIEDCTKRAKGSGLFWGAALQNRQWIGQNILGKIWMTLRENRRINI